MKKYIFLQKDLEAGNIHPYLILNVDENEKEFVMEDYVLLQMEEFLQELYYYDFEKKELREKTKLQLFKENLYSLEQGEIFDEEKQEFSFIQNPSSWHVWDGHNWTVDLEEVKRKKREELKYIRDEKIYENLEVNASIFQVRKQDLEKFFLKKIEADFNPALKEKKEIWILADNSFKAIDFNDIQDIFKAFGERQRKLFQHFGQLSIQLQQAQSLEEIEKIKWNEGI